MKETVLVGGIRRSAGHRLPAPPDGLHQFFERSCDSTPDARALICADICLSYEQLDGRANQLAHFLTGQGVQPGDRVGLLLERSVDTYAALLAILKCGAAFVPLDPAFPADRIAFISTDADLRLLISTSAFAAATAAVACPVVFLDRVRAEVACESTERLEVEEATPGALAYIIYTSGTTGRPKGVAVEQASICNFLRVCTPIYEIRASDRVYQGMTLAFDFSIEEVWPTFAVGATLVAGPTDHRRLGAGLNDFLIEHGITVFCCVPTLLATLETEVPTLRRLLVGGEACPADLVRRWARPGRRILNTYGPTETTVTATWGELLPDRPVTIGRPLPTYHVRLLDDQRRPVRRGEVGEICIGGPGVAVGYVNLPEATADRFIADPLASAGRLYRSGDLGRLTPNGEIEYLGRIDTQVKIRGYRIELGEIEAVLREDEDVLAAVAATVPGAGTAELAAYIIPRPGADLGVVRPRLFAELQRRLPACMVPAYLETIATLPMLPSNKVDRARLPQPTGPRRLAGCAAATTPATALELAIAGVWAGVLGHAVDSVEADFFLDYGGHSLFAARVVSELRRLPELGRLGLADLYANPTIRGLAKLATAASPPAPPSRPTERVLHGSGRVWLAGLVQFGMLYLALIPWLVPTGAFLLLFAAEEEFSTAGLLVPIVAVMLVAPFVGLVLPLLAKWLLLGRVTPGRHRLWGWFFCRWWLVRKLIQAAPLDALAGTPFLAAYLRLLGARVGPGCHLGTQSFDMPDLVEIGADVSLGYNVEVDPAHIAGGWLVLRPIRIGAGANIGTNSVVQGGAEVGAGAWIAEQTLVTSGQSIPAGETWAGSPARQAAASENNGLPTDRVPPRRWSPALLAGFAAGSFLLLLLPTLLLIPGLFLVWGISGGDLLLGLALTPLAGLSHVLLTCAVVVAGKWLVNPATRPGVYPLRSSFGLRKWFTDRLMNLSLTQTNALYATLYLNPFLRLLGVQVGPRAEVSTVAHIDPDLLTLGEECFVADLAVLGAARVASGWILLGATQVGKRAFVGNAALVPGHTQLEADSLLGVLSVPPETEQRSCVPAGTSWMGSPAIFLPRRQASDPFDEGLTYRPPTRLVVCRLAIEFLRVILPATLSFVAMFLLAWTGGALLGFVSWLAFVLLLPALYLGAGLTVTLLVVGLKWLVVGRYRPRVEPQYAPFVFRTEFITALYENVALPWLLHWLSGTPLMAPVLRLFGAKVGKRVYMESDYLTEFDLVEVGDDAAVAGQVSLQTHLFEDRVMKMGRVVVGRGAALGTRAVVLYDAVVGDDAEVDGLSLVMKGETLPAESHHRGIPARPVV